jgi:hypothetical protein
MEAEYVALSSSCCDLFLLVDITQEICSALFLHPPDTVQMHIKIHEDNVGTLILGQLEPGQMTPRSTHYVVQYHCFLRTSSSLQNSTGQNCHKRSTQ